MPHFPDEIEYSEKYQDDEFEYRHVLLPKTVYRNMPRGRLLYEEEWRQLGVQQSRGWVHYEIHKPEPFILLFRRPLGTDPTTGKVAETHALASVHNAMLKNPNVIRQQNDGAAAATSQQRM